MKWYRLDVTSQDIVKDLMKNILVDVQSLSNSQVFKAATRTQVQGLQNAIKELAQVKSWFLASGDTMFMVMDLSTVDMGILILLFRTA